MMTTADRAQMLNFQMRKGELTAPSRLLPTKPLTRPRYDRIMRLAKDLERTPWFPRGSRPVRAGWYEVENLFVGKGTDCHMLAWFDGVDFRSNATLQAFLLQRRAWRGLTSEVK